MLNFSWVHTFSHDGLLNVSPFYHFNGSNYDSSPDDFPNSVTVHRNSTYAGGQATIGSTVARNTWRAGLYGFWQRDDQLFGVLFNDGIRAAAAVTQQTVNGNLEALFVQDKFAITPWLTLDGGVRQSHFSSSSVSEDATSPRAGVAVEVPRLNWVFRGFYGQFYQAPPLITIGGQLLGFVNTPDSPENPQQFVPLLGERDTERQFGVTIPLRGWSADLDTFRTFSHNFLDHGNVNYDFDGTVFPTNIYLPLTTQEALIRGWELTLRSPRLWKRVETHLAYSNQIAEFMGTITGGLTIPGAPPQAGWAPLDHDQRNTLSVGFAANLPWKTLLSGNVTYGSGFTNGADDGTPESPQYLAAHTTVDLGASKSIGERWTVSVNGVNIGNSHLLIDDSLTFGGFHYDEPREVYGELRYRFHY